MRRRTARIGGEAGALVLAVLVAGCVPFGQDDAPPPPCPTVSILADAAKVTFFRPGGGRDLIDVTHEGEIAGFSGSCLYTDDEDTGERVIEMSIGVQFATARGPANPTGSAPYRYFVALATGDRKIVTKRQFDFSSAFEPNVGRAVVTDAPVSLTIPLREGQDAASYQIFVGFQLDHDQLDYNRSQVRR